jgi:putative transposase
MERWFRTVRLQLLPTLQPEDKTSREAINRHLWVWVEGDYHRNPRRGLDGDTPADRRARCCEDVRLAEGDTSDLFLFAQKRRVQADRTVSLDSVAYEVDATLVGETVTLRYDPVRPREQRSVQVLAARQACRAGAPCRCVRQLLRTSRPHDEGAATVSPGAIHARRTAHA